MISRRDMLKYGVATATLSGVSLRPADADDGGGVGKTPFKTEPFIEPLPVPAIKKALNDTPTTNCLHRRGAPGWRGPGRSSAVRP